MCVYFTCIHLFFSTNGVIIFFLPLLTTFLSHLFFHFLLYFPSSSSSSSSSFSSSLSSSFHFLAVFSTIIPSFSTSSSSFLPSFLPSFFLGNTILTFHFVSLEVSFSASKTILRFLLCPESRPFEASLCYSESSLISFREPES